MAKTPDYKVVKTDGQTGRKSTVSRTAGTDAAHAKKAEHRANTTLGSSDSFTIDKIRHRK